MDQANQEAERAFKRRMESNPYSLANLAYGGKMRRIAFFFTVMAFGSIGMVHAGDPVAGKQKAGSCIECHGENGTPGKVGVPKIDRMAPDTFAAAIQKMREVHHDVPIAAHALNDEDIADIAAYFTFSK